ncbi:N-acetylmuramoyl-L-alanine amidase [Spirosoma daeguense]
MKLVQKTKGKCCVGWFICLALVLIQSSLNRVIALDQGKGRTSANSKKAAGNSRSLTDKSKRLTTSKAVADKKESAAITASFLGKKHARVLIKDHKLRGAVYYLASGHGGPDPGAIGHYGKQLLAEDEYAYDVTVRLARALMEHGATVYMMVRDPNDGIRDDSILKIDHDEVAYPNQKIPLNQTLRLRQCTDAVNKLHRKHKGAYQRLVTIHVDSRSEGENIDVFFYHHENSKAGQKLAKHIHKSFKSGYRRSQPNRNYLGTVSDRSSLYVVKNSHPPTVFIELGNIRNTKDQRRFLIADNRQALANWICAGLQKDLNRSGE